jgi:hypothetical protein
MEMSMGGQAQHAIAGWNHGYPPYPYTTVVDENAPLRENRFGVRPKKRLVPHPDPRQFETAREVHRLRREEHLLGQDIVAILEAEPDRYPRDGGWTWNRVELLLANPKLTGYMVYNRKANRTGKPGYSKLNPISEWVWSPHPTHEAVVSLEEWKEAQEVTAALRAGSDADGPLLRIRAAARALGLTVTVTQTSPTHAQYRIGGRQIILPVPVPAAVAQQLIEDMGSAE